MGERAEPLPPTFTPNARPYQVVHFDTEECCDRLEVTRPWAVRVRVRVRVDPSPSPSPNPNPNQVTALGGGTRSTDERHGYARPPPEEYDEFAWGGGVAVRDRHWSSWAEQADSPAP